MNGQTYVTEAEIGGSLFGENYFYPREDLLDAPLSHAWTVWETESRAENKSGWLAVTSVFAALTSFSCEKARRKKKGRRFMSGRKELRLLCGYRSTREPYAFFAICDIHGGYAVWADVDAFFSFFRKDDTAGMHILSEKLSNWRGPMARFLTLIYRAVYEYCNYILHFKNNSEICNIIK